MEELWKDIEGYEGIYQISSIGRVKTLPIEQPLPKGGTYITVEKIRKLDNRKGYPSTKLWLDNKYQHKSVHRLVALAFIPNPYNYPIINHIDSDKGNPRVSNLEWCTPPQNIQHSIESGTYPTGSQRYNNKLVEEDIPEIYKMRESGLTYREISEVYQVTIGCIFNVCKGITWKKQGRMVPVPKPHNYRPPKRGFKPNFKATPMAY